MGSSRPADNETSSSQQNSLHKVLSEQVQITPYSLKAQRAKRPWQASKSFFLEIMGSISRFPQTCAAPLESTGWKLLLPSHQISIPETPTPIQSAALSFHRLRAFSHIQQIQGTRSRITLQSHPGCNPTILLAPLMLPCGP
nr:hypothetical protein Iba_chr08cCG8340 [Ipomoea batatas]